MNGAFFRQPVQLSIYRFASFRKLAMIRAMTMAIGSAAMMDTVCRLDILFSEKISALSGA